MTRRVIECVAENQPYLDHPTEVKRLQLQGGIATYRPEDFFGLTELEELFFTPDMTELRDSLDRIPEVDEGKFGPKTEIYPGLFIGLPKLKRLHILMKGITTLTAESFRGLDQLLVLNLSGNRISKIEKGAFAPLLNLETLSLDGNSLLEIRPAFFEPLPKLVDLDLSGNRIKRLRPGSFSGNKDLCLLNLERNRLTYLARQTFAGLARLSSLHLNANPLCSSYANSFCCLDKHALVSLTRSGKVVCAAAGVAVA